MQTAGAVSGTASEELILLYNSSDVDIEITNWNLQDSLASSGVSFSNIATATPPDSQTELWLSAGGIVSFATIEYINRANSTLPLGSEFVPDFVFTASLTATGGHLRLVTNLGQEVDRVSWGSAVLVEGIEPAISHNLGEVLSRDLTAIEIDTDNNLIDFSSHAVLSPIISGLYEKEIVIDLCANLPGVQVEFPIGYLADENGDCYEDFCPNIDGLQIIAPDGYQKKLGEMDCSEIPKESRVLFITELLPNAPSTDKGQEFIEIYNPNTELIDLEGYKIQVGPSFTKEFIFSTGMIEPGAYIVLSDTESGIILPNTNGVQLRIISPAGEIVSQSDVYSNADDDVSWALIDDIWVYTNQITPGSANKPYLIEPVDEVSGVTSVYAPCPVGKFRNPDTNRCKSIETAVSILAPCDEDEFRNPETNRCKKNTSNTSTLTPCKEGQERNPETNRCRNVSVLGASSEDLPVVEDVQTVNTAGQVNWFVIIMAISFAAGYMVYEWRSEISHSLVRFKRA
jgi:hypothetical protein